MKITQIPMGTHNAQLTCYLQEPCTEMPALDRCPAILIFPGGAYAFCSDREADPVALAFLNAGYNAFVLRYSVSQNCPVEEVYTNAFAEAQEAMDYLHQNAGDLHIDPEQIAVVGFSAGGHLSAMASNNFDKRTYPAVDAADKASCRPDFCLLVYPAYLDGENFQLAPEVKVSSATPPTMMIQAEDDKSYINSSLFYYYALKEAGVPAWMHLYSKGGHGYGLRDTGAAVNEWPDRAEDWFREIGVIE